MADAPTSYTTNYSFKKWNDGYHPGAIGWNSNWDAIDAAIKNAASSGPAPVSYSFSAPLVNTAGVISLGISDNLKLTGSALDTIQAIKTTSNLRFAKLGLGMDAVNALDVLGNGHLTGDLVVDGNFTVNGDTVVLNAYELAVEDKNITLGNSEDISDITAAGGGITLKGTTDKTLIWNNDGRGWTSSEDFNLLTGKAFKINGTVVLNADTLGANIVNSSLTKLGTINTGVWQGTPVGRSYIATGTPDHIIVNDADGKLSSLASLNVGRGGTGLSTLTSNKVYKGNGVLAMQESSITDDGTNTEIAPAGTFYFNTGVGSILPKDKYFENLGSLTNKYLTLHAAELWVNTLVAQNTIATIGGRVAVAPTSILILDLAPSDQIMYVKHNQMVTGDIVYLESAGKVEFLMIDSGATSVVGGYSYAILRNLDGSGANQWYAGDALMNTGQTGNGFIDIYSVRGIKSSTQSGPTIVGNVRNSNTYNDWSEHWAIGNLKGLYGYGTSTYGVGLGKYGNGSSFITIDTTNGLQFKNRTAGGVERVSIKLAQDGSGYVGNGFMKWGTDNVVSIGNWTIEQYRLINGSTRLENSTDFKGLAVNNGSYDSMKFGDFTMPDLTYTPTNATSSQMTNADFESGSFTGWTQTGSGATRSIAYGGASSGSCYALINCSNYTTLAFQYDLRQSFSNPTALQGKHIQIKIALALGSWSNSGNYPTTIAPVSVALANQTKTFAITSFIPGSSWSDFVLDAVVPSDSTAVTLIISGNFASPQNYYSTMIDNIRPLVYDKNYSYINSLGFSHYNSPYNYFKMQGGSMSMGLSELKVNGDTVATYRGEYASGTPPNPQIGQWYTSGNYIYFYNGSAWKRFISA